MIVQKSKFAAVKCRASPKFLEAGFSGASRTTLRRFGDYSLKWIWLTGVLRE